MAKETKKRQDADYCEVCERIIRGKHLDSKHGSGRYGLKKA